MKKLQIWMLTLVGWCSVLSLHAQEFTYENFKYKVLSESDKTVEIVGFEEYEAEVVIPDFAEYNGAKYAVTTIGDSAFYRYHVMFSVDLGNVTKIGTRAFGNSALTSIDLKNVTSIGIGAFERNAMLTSLDLGHITSIPAYAFASCYRLRSLDLKEVTSIGAYAFDWSSGLTSLDLKNVTFIGEGAFDRCTSLTRIKAPAQVPTIESRAFVKDSQVYVEEHSSDAYKADPQWSLYNIHVYDFCRDSIFYRINSISERTSTYLCDFMPNVDNKRIPESVEYKGRVFTVDSIGEGAFAGCRNLKSVDLGKVTSIGPRAFSECSNLDTIGFKNKTSIGEYAFASCSKLTSLDLKNVTSIGEGAFSDCYRLTSIELRDFSSIGRKVFSECTALLSVDLKKVTSIGESAFEGCSNLATIDLSNVTVIEDRAFWGCSNLIILNLSKVASIGESAFKNCELLTKAYLPVSAPLQYDSFKPGTTILVPRGGLHSYQENSYYWKDCVLIEYDFTEDQADYLINSEDESTVALVCPAFEFPAGHYTMGEVTHNGQKYDVSEIGAYVYKYDSALLSFNSNKIKVIRKSAFEGCSNLESLALRNVDTIEADAFKGCGSLKSILVCTTVPPIIEAESTFDKKVYLDATLYVPTGCKKAYEEALYWRDFLIQETDDLTGIETISTVNTIGDIYDLNGRVVKAQSLDTEGLRPGVYIRNGKKVMVK